MPAVREPAGPLLYCGATKLSPTRWTVGSASGRTSTADSPVTAGPHRSAPLLGWFVDFHQRATDRGGDSSYRRSR